MKARVQVDALQLKADDTIERYRRIAAWMALCSSIRWNWRCGSCTVAAGGGGTAIEAFEVAKDGTIRKVKFWSKLDGQWSATPDVYARLVFRPRASARDCP